MNVHLVLDPLRLGASVPQAWWLLGRMRPDVVFTTGGYLGIPLVLAARARAHPEHGLGGERGARQGDRRGGALRRSRRRLVPADPGCLPGALVRLGNADPLVRRASIARRPAQAWARTRTDRLLLAFGGSQAVARLTAAIEGSLEQLLDRMAGPAHHRGDRDARLPIGRAERLPEEMRDRYRPVAFLTDGMAEALLAADLVLGRAGSSTCAEVTAVGLASILVPYPFASAHQRENAAWLADQGAARLVPDAELDAARLLREASDLRDDAASAARWQRPLGVSAGPTPPSASRRSWWRWLECRRERRDRSSGSTSWRPERGIELDRDRPMAPLTTLRVGGPADRMLPARDRDELLIGLRIARQAGVPFFLLGNGSDLVVSDRGIRGLVIRNRARHVALDDTELTADSGAAMAMLVKRCTAAGLAGFEFGISIPGTLGGAVWANAGAHGGDMRGSGRRR